MTKSTVYQMKNDEKGRTITFEGKSYVLVNDAQMTNSGINGGVVFTAKAVDSGGKDYDVVWGTLPDWDRGGELVKLEEHLYAEGKTMLSHYRKQVLRRIREIKSLGYIDVTGDDYSEACEWDYPISITPC